MGTEGTNYEITDALIQSPHWPLTNTQAEVVRAASAAGKVHEIGSRGDAEPIRGVSGTEYPGIGGFDLSDVTATSDLILMTTEDLEQQGYAKSSVSALLGHRTRKLKAALRDGTFPQDVVHAMVNAGYLVSSED